MATYVNSNNAYSTLAGNVSNVATTFTVAAGEGVRFPTVTAPDWTYCTFQNSANVIEIIKITAHAVGTDSFTCTRAQESTSAVAWVIGDVVELRLTAGTAVTVDGTQTVTNKTLTSAVMTTPVLNGVATTGSGFTLPAVTLGGTVSGGGKNLNNVIIGAVTPLAGAFTTISATGLITATGGQIAFPATQVASSDPNTLDDYEEGTYTPSLGGSATYTNQVGVYVKIGSVVTVGIFLNINAIGTGSTTAVTNGLPFVPESINYVFACAFTGSVTNVTTLVARATGVSTDLSMQSMTAAGPSMGNSAIFQNGTTLRYSGSYKV